MSITRYCALIFFLFGLTPSLFAAVIQSGSDPAPTPSAPPSQPAGQTDYSSLPQLSPQQSQELMQRAQNMDPNEMKAMAEAFQSQMQAAKQASGTSAAPPPSGPVPVSAAPAPLPPPSVSVEDEMRKEAFHDLLTDVLPMSPDQITRLRKYYDVTLQATATPAKPPPTPHFTSLNVNLQPGSQPPVIRLATGFVSSVLFVDTTGAPWPLTAYSIGDPKAFNIQWDQKSNALFIQSMQQYSHGNLAVRLFGLSTPVMLTLVSGQKDVDFRVDLQVAGRGPDAKPAIMPTAATSAQVNSLLINVLDGIPPKDSIKLGVSGGHGEAWLNDSRVYFRTRLTVLSPAWTATVSSADGTHVYEMMPTPYILATNNGKTVDIKLSGL